LSLAISYWAEHKYAQAIQEFENYSKLSGDRNDAELTAARDAGFRAGGWPESQRRAVEVLLAQRKDKAEYVSSYIIAEIYADLGDKDHAFEWLNTSYQEHDPWLYAIRTDFTMDSLRSDPRYADLLRKIGLPPLTSPR